MLLVSGDNYPIDFNISKNRISLIIDLPQKRHRRKESCNKKICLKNRSVIHLELLATHAILPKMSLSQLAIAFFLPWTWLFMI